MTYHRLITGIVAIALAITSTDSAVASSTRLPVEVKRGAATWTINADGIVTSKIDYSVGSGSGSKKYSTGLIVELENGEIYYAVATKTVGRHAYKTRKGTAKNTNHVALPRDQLGKIKRAYAIYKTGTSGPGTIKEWVEKAKEWAREGKDIYKEFGGDVVKPMTSLSTSRLPAVTPRILRLK